MINNILDIFYLSSFNIFQWFVQHTPDFIKFPTIRGLAKLAYLLDAKHRRIAKANLDLAYEDTLNDAEKDDIIKKCYENMLFNLADFVENQGISKDHLLSKVEFINSEFVTNAQQNGKKIIFLTAHYGNWELLALAIAAKFGPLSVVGRPLDSKTMDEILKRNREQFDIQLIPKRRAMKPLINALKNNRMVGLLVDQNTTAKEGLLVDFFGKKARHSPSIAILSRRFNALIIPVFITTEDHINHTITFYEPFTTPNSNNQEEDIFNSTQRQALITEEVIRKKPDEWFWLHRRWKDQYGKIYEK